MEVADEDVMGERPMERSEEKEEADEGNEAASFLGRAKFSPGRAASAVPGPNPRRQVGPGRGCCSPATA